MLSNKEITKRLKVSSNCEFVAASKKDIKKTQKPVVKRKR